MFVLIAFSIVCGLVPDSSAHDRPVIGVLVQEISKLFELLYPNQFDSFVPASYVKWIESAGARVVPIFPGEPPAYYESMVSKINGVLFPGGNVDKNAKAGYADAAERIFKIANELNSRKDYFPIFGIGWGMDYMLYLTDDHRDDTIDCKLDTMAASLVLSKKSTKQTALYNSSSEHIKRIMTSHPVAVLNARRCYAKESFEKSKLAEQWIPFSYNIDKKGQMIVSAIEHREFPFYGTLFHSEKIAFEWTENSNLPHTLATLETSQYFANYFVNEARKSMHDFASETEVLENVIQNWQPVFTAKDGSSFFQAYLFNSRNN